MERENERRPSYERINYALRPAKCIERRMLCETFLRLSEFGPLDSYTYIGFGATHFCDFSLFHKTLGIGNMISIEKEVKDEKRIEFNKPFRCIELRFGPSKDVLPTLKLDQRRTILWLDYDYPLDAGVLTDVQLFCTEAVPGSILVVTVNAEPGAPDFGRLERLKERVGKGMIPLGIEERDLTKWGTARVYRAIVHNQILDTLRQRNGGRPKGKSILYRQLFNFHYADGAKMLTVGGLLYDETQAEAVDRCEFHRLSFVSGSEKEFRIDAPVLTYREIKFLDSLLPTDNPDELQVDWLPRKALRGYMELYRYYPVYGETEVS